MEKPAPVRFEGNKSERGARKGAGEMRRGGVDGDDGVKIKHRGGGLRKVGKVRREVDHGEGQRL